MPSNMSKPDITFKEQEWYVEDLRNTLALCPSTYSVLLCADDVLPPSPWTRRFRIEVNHEYKVVRITGSLT